MRRVAPAALVPLLAASLVVLGPSPAGATIISVTTTEDELNTDGDCSLREAVVAANTDAARDACPAGSGADTIDLPAGTYTLDIAGADENAASGDLDIAGDLTIKGAGARNTVVDGADIDRVFDVFNISTVVMRRITIQNGSLNGDGGAGIDSQGDLTLEWVTLRSNQATGATPSDAGGGIRASEPSP